MNFRTATLLVLGMFGSFSIVIGVMFFLFWKPEAKPRRAVDRSAIENTAPAWLDTIRTNAPTIDPPEPMAAEDEEAPAPASMPAEPPIPEKVEEEPQEDTKPPTVRFVRPVPGQKTQKSLAVELSEMQLLREEMDRRLKARIEMRERKLDQLARQCANLEPGEAAQILVTLDDTDLKHTLERMDRAQAIQIAALLKRLGRESAISIK